MIGDRPDYLSWEVGVDGMFTVSSLRVWFDSLWFRGSNLATQWNRLVPRKVNVLGWRIGIDRIPTRFNLSRKGIMVESLMCPVCKRQGETALHLFGRCSEIAPMLGCIARWWDVPDIEVSTLDSLVSWADRVKLDGESRKHCDAVIVSGYIYIFMYITVFVI